VAVFKPFEPNFEVGGMSQLRSAGLISDPQLGKRLLGNLVLNKS
jgi:hypothetical protein